MIPKPKAIDVLLFVEHKDRELAVAVQISQDLAQRRELKVVVASQIFDATLSVFRYKPKVLLTPTTAFAPGSVAWMFYQLYGDQIVYVSLNYEQFLGRWESKTKLRFCDVSRYCQRHFAWGENFANVLKDNGVEGRNIYVTGRPMNTLIDRMHNQGRHEAKKVLVAELGVPASSRIFLFGLTDGIAFCGPKIIKSVATRGFEEENVKRLAAHVLRTIEIMIEWILVLATELPPDCHMVIRPHPTVSVEDYEGLFHKMSKCVPRIVHITKSHDAQKWIAGSDVFISNYSTLLLDADALGVPTYVLKLDQSPHGENYWWCEGRPTVGEYSEFASIFTSTAFSFRGPSQIEEYLSHNTDGVSVTCDYVETFARENPRDLDAIEISYRRYLRIFGGAPQRVLGSALRKFLMSWTAPPLTKFVNAGIRHDYFDPKHYDPE